jgi:hypothetical protein
MGIWRKVRWRRKVREVEGKLKGREIETMSQFNWQGSESDICLQWDVN